MKQSILKVALLFALILGVRDGRLALLETSQDAPLAVYPQLVSMLPGEDQMKLTAGIPVRSQIHLAQLLEDYLS